MKKEKTSLYFCRCAIIATIYFLLTIAVFPISYGVIQLRIAEGLTLLPLLYAESVPGLFIGCLFANMFSPTPLDMVVGSLTTLIAAFLTRKIKLPYLAGLSPIILNATMLPLMWYFIGGHGAFYVNFVSILISQTIAVYVFGLPLHYALKRIKARRQGKYKPKEKKNTTKI